MEELKAVVTWAPQMTEREYFNANIACGQLPTERAKLLGLSNPGAGCGAKNWRVILRPWMEDKPERRERELICLGCGNQTEVVVLP